MRVRFCGWRAGSVVGRWHRERSGRSGSPYGKQSQNIERHSYTSAFPLRRGEISAATMKIAGIGIVCSYRFPAQGRFSQLQWGPVVDVAKKLAIVGGENDRGVGRGQCLGEFVDEGD